MARVGHWPRVGRIIAIVVTSLVMVAACSSQVEHSTSTHSVGPNLSAVNDLASFTSAVDAYRGPYTTTTKPSAGSTSVYHFDGANYSLRDTPGDPISEYRIIADGPNGGRTCFTTDDGDEWLYETGAPLPDSRVWSLGMTLPRMDPSGGLVRTPSGFEYRDQSPASPSSLARVTFALTDGSLRRATITDAAGHKSFQSYDFESEPRIDQPRHASDQGMDVTC